MQEVIEKIKDINNYLVGDYKVIKKYLEDRYLYTNNEIFKSELIRLKNELTNKKISDIDIINKYYSVYMRSKLHFNNFKTLAEKQKHMQYGQIIYYVDKVLKGEFNIDWIELDKNIVQKGNVYYLKDTEIKLFEDVEVDNKGIYYYACDVDIALDINNIQKIFSNEIMDLDYLAQSFYNNNKIFFHEEEQEGYNFKVNLSRYKVYKRIYFVDVGFKEIYYIKENEIDINSKVNIDTNKNNTNIYSFMKNSIIDFRNKLPFLKDYEEKIKVFKDYNIDFKEHLLALKGVDKEVHDDYIIVKNHEGIHKIYKDNSYTRYFHATSLNSAKNIVKEGFLTDNNIIDFDFNKIFISPNIYIAKFYGAIGGINTDTNASDKYIIFECNLDDYEDKLYHYIHTVEHFIYDNEPIEPSVIKRIWLVENNVIQKEITKKELLKMEV